jgi:hypothetical protein
MRLLTAAVLVATFAFVLVSEAIVSSTASAESSAREWESNVWQSPTGSIMCRYSPWLSTIRCTSQRTGLSVRLGNGDDAPPGVDPGPARRAPLWSVRHVPGRFEPKLVYGVPWTSDTFRCRAQANGVRCWVNPGLRELLGNHGFLLNPRHSTRW